MGSEMCIRDRQRDVEYYTEYLDGLKSTALERVKKDEGPISAIYREVLDEQGNVKTGPIKFPVDRVIELTHFVLDPMNPFRDAADQVRFLRKNMTMAIDAKEKAEKELADLIKGKLRTPSKTAGPTYVLAEAAFPLGGITAAIAYDVNQRGDR